MFFWFLFDDMQIAWFVIFLENFNSSHNYDKKSQNDTSVVASIFFDRFNETVLPVAVQSNVILLNSCNTFKHIVPKCARFVWHVIQFVQRSTGCVGGFEFDKIDAVFQGFCMTHYIVFLTLSLSILKVLAVIGLFQLGQLWFGVNETTDPGIHATDRSVDLHCFVTSPTFIGTVVRFRVAHLNSIRIGLVLTCVSDTFVHVLNIRQSSFVFLPQHLTRVQQFALSAVGYV